MSVLFQFIILSLFIVLDAFLDISIQDRYGNDNYRLFLIILTIGIVALTIFRYVKQIDTSELYQRFEHSNVNKMFKGWMLIILPLLILGMAIAIAVIAKK